MSRLVQSRPPLLPFLQFKVYTLWLNQVYDFKLQTAFPSELLECSQGVAPAQSPVRACAGLWSAARRSLARVSAEAEVPASSVSLRARRLPSAFAVPTRVPLRRTPGLPQDGGQYQPHQRDPGELGQQGQ